MTRTDYWSSWLLVPLVLALPVVSTSLAYTAPAPKPAPPVDAAAFQAKLAGVLQKKCLSCHRPGNAKGGFDMTTRAGMLKGGDLGASLVSGKPEESPVYTRAVAPKGQKPEMPEKGEPLTAAEADLLRRWIAAGASWPESVVLAERSKADRSWWAYRKLSTAPPPSVAGIPAAWNRNPIDRFIYAELKGKGLTPNPPAEPRALIRRATFDLTGLPPTPEEVSQFLRECEAEQRMQGKRGRGPGVGGQGGKAGLTPRAQRVDPTSAASKPHERQRVGPAQSASSAYERLIDRLLASPQYGERWGRHWLDVVRFGESNGFERNVLINNVWPFRDYVIRSFNEDKPFDRLALEHLAGDVVGQGDPNVEIGTAFLVCGAYDNVGNQDAAAAAQIRADTLDDMVRATGEAFLGTTVGCARCHDHKFDPVATKDYYSLYATFAGVSHGDRLIATPEQQAQHSATLKPLEAERKRHAEMRDQVVQAVGKRAQQQAAALEAKWTRPVVDRAGTEERFTPVEARLLRLVVTSRDDQPTQNTGVRIDEFEVWSAGDRPRNVALAANGGTAEGASRVAPDFADAYSASLTIDGKYGARWIAASPTLTLRFARPERIDRVFFSNDRVSGDRGQRTSFVGDYRIEVSADGQNWKEVASSADRRPASPALRDHRLFTATITPAEQSRLVELQKEIARLETEIAKIPPLPRWWVGQFRNAPGPFNVFIGGDPQKKGEGVVPASFSTLSEVSRGYRLEAALPESERRLALAKWLTSPDNPLTPRVLANRVWHYHFGTGIVDTPSDFGYMGGRPSHPELLDYLATVLSSPAATLGAQGSKGAGGKGEGILVNAATPGAGGSNPPRIGGRGADSQYALRDTHYHDNLTPPPPARGYPALSGAERGEPSRTILVRSAAGSKYASRDTQYAASAPRESPANTAMGFGWRLKALHRLIMTSQTYRQAATHRPAAARVDGDSRLLWRFPPRRLSAEEVRDTMLAVAGKLDTRMGGPGFRLYEYQEDNVATYVPLNGHGPETYRRSVYHQNARAARVDLLTDFDCPDPAFAVARRASTTTPLQALTLMNHAFSVDMAAALTDRVRKEAPAGLAAQVRRAYQLCYGRPPAAEELAACVRLVEKHGLSSLSRVLLNSNELVYLQ